MAGKNQVTLTFAGDESKLSQSFERVGAAADGMKARVGDASNRVGESASSFDRVGEAADGAEGKAQGFSDTLTGTADIAAGAGQIMKGNLFEGFVTVGQGAADLAGGLASFVIPAIKNMTKASIANAVQNVRTTATTVAQKGAMLASAAATRVMTVAQRGLNLAMRANPIGIVITVLAALVAGIVIAYNKSATFRRIVQASMLGVKVAFQTVVKAGAAVVGWFKELPGRISGFMGGVANVITRPFRDAFNSIRNFWNSTIGGKGFSIPSWVPEIGGKSFRIPRFHTGGVMPGAPGTEGLALLQAGERVTAAGHSGGTQVVEIRFTGGMAALVNALKKEIRTQGGNVQAVLGT